MTFYWFIRHVSWLFLLASMFLFVFVAGQITTAVVWMVVINFIILVLFRYVARWESNLPKLPKDKA